MQGKNIITDALTVKIVLGIFHLRMRADIVEVASSNKVKEILVVLNARLKRNLPRIEQNA